MSRKRRRNINFDEIICKAVRLRILDLPRGITPGVIDFTVFGRRYTEGK